MTKTTQELLQQVRVRLKNSCSCNYEYENCSACQALPALEELQRRLGWQPIESAPRDGIRYLGVIVGDRFYGEPFVCYYDEDEGHVCLHQTEARLHRPTHWMHFSEPNIKPQPPQAKGAGE